jgi:hypothetical protein
MAAVDNEDPRIQYSAAGGETEFQFPWLVYSDAAGGSSYLKVIRVRAGIATTLVVTTDYTVANLNVEAGGSITLTSAAQAGDVYILYRELPIETFFSFADGGDYFAQSVNKNSNLALQILQQLRLQIKRSAALPPESTVSALALPLPNALSFLRWNAAANALENHPAGPSNPVTGIISNSNALYRQDPYIPAMLEALVNGVAIGVGHIYYFPFVVTDTAKYSAFLTRCRNNGAGAFDLSLAIYSIGTRTGAQYACTRLHGNYANDAQNSINGNSTVRFSFGATPITLSAGLYMIGIRRNAGATNHFYNGPINMGHAAISNGPNGHQCMMVDNSGAALGASFTFNPNAGTPSTSTCFPFSFLEFSSYQ